MGRRLGLTAVAFFFVVAAPFLMPQTGPESDENQGGLDSAAPPVQQSRFFFEEVIKRENQPVSGLIPPNRGRVPAPEDQTHRSLVIPVSGARLTSPFGPRGNGMHWGVDLAAPEGRSVRAAAAGEVVFAGWNGAYGLLIILDHAGFRTYYAHNSVLWVEKNQQVAAGEIIAAVGRTGRATGSHLHFELEIEGRKINPLPYLKRTPEMVLTGRAGPEGKNNIIATKKEKERGKGEK